MKLKPIADIENKLKNCEDAEELAEGHYALDVYDTEKPVTFELELNSRGLFCPAAAYLEYSDADDGYYMGERITDVKTVQAALEKWAAGQVIPDQE